MVVVIVVVVVGLGVVVVVGLAVVVGLTVVVVVVGGGGGVVVGLVVSGFAASACYKALVAKNRLKTQTNVAQWAALVDNLDVLGYMLNIYN